MKGEAEMTVPEFALVLGTRAAFGVGLGLLLANRFSESTRRAVGWTLLLAGSFGGAVLASELFGRPRSLHMTFGPQGEGSQSRSKTDNLLIREMLKVGD